MSILVVDDNPAVRMMLADILHDEGYHVVCAANGAEALIMLRGHPHPVQLILLDLDMPIMNGWEFRQRQMQEPAFAAIPVVVISAQPEVAHKVDSLGVADYLPKPVVYDTLLDTVKYHYTVSGRVQHR